MLVVFQSIKPVNGPVSEEWSTVARRARVNSNCKFVYGDRWVEISCKIYWEETIDYHKKYLRMIFVKFLQVTTYLTLYVFPHFLKSHPSGSQNELFTTACKFVVTCSQLPNTQHMLSAVIWDSLKHYAVSVLEVDLLCSASLDYSYWYSTLLCWVSVQPCQEVTRATNKMQVW